MIVKQLQIDLPFEWKSYIFEHKGKMATVELVTFHIRGKLKVKSGFLGSTIPDKYFRKARSYKLFFDGVYYNSYSSLKKTKEIFKRIAENEIS